MSHHRRGRALLLAGLALWLAVAAATVLARRYLYNVLLGPFPVDRDALAAVTDVDSRWEYHVSLEPSAVRPLFPYAHSGGPRPYSVYALLRVGGGTVLARLPAGHGERLSGTLEGLSAFEKTQVLAPLTNSPSAPRDILPFRFNATRPFRTGGFLLGVLPLAATAGLGAWMVVVGIRRR